MWIAAAIYLLIGVGGAVWYFADPEGGADTEYVNERICVTLILVFFWAPLLIVIVPSAAGKAIAEHRKDSK